MKLLRLRSQRYVDHVHFLSFFPWPIALCCCLPIHFLSPLPSLATSVVTTRVFPTPRREKLLTEHLKRIYGPTFSIEAELAAASSSSSPSDAGNRSFVASPCLSGGRRTSGVAAPLARSSSGSLLAQLAEEPPAKRGRAAAAAQWEPEALMQSLADTQEMVGRFERRLLIRESELIKKEEEAQRESRRLEKLAAVTAAA